MKANFVTLLLIFIAYLSYKANVQKSNDDRDRDHDKELLAQARTSLQWAYNALTDDGATIPPRADRLNWLTSARHLLRTKTLADRIKNSTYRTIYDEIEEYWRGKFYGALSHDALRLWTYYADEAKPHWPEKIEITSALIIIDFLNWKKGAPDPTDAADRHES